ncbi:Exostosin domain-containing protein [Heracleum sosnowskyi]|uniref:Exostosin domain-containing protein n=1 Tax=Heracleum sosnowskyi TaxID=360622 RepID=A0AAD8M9U9_9APIA|nr:Exostosin domain-containing protein [Heracleum sosnowskyi]
MKITQLSLIFLCFSLFISIQSQSTSLSKTTYLSPTILLANYAKMIAEFKIYVYKTPKPISPTFTNSPESVFYNNLLKSEFVTQNADEAHLFFVPFAPDTSTRALARLVREIRQSFPYWNRSLGADHFFISRAGIDYASDRNVLELKKNSVQISCFPTKSGNFVPHKDITLAPAVDSPIELPHAPANKSTSFLGYMKLNKDDKSTGSFIDEMIDDQDFLIESEPSNHKSNIDTSKYCIFIYNSDMNWFVEAISSGCVPVIITDRPVQDLPLMDVIRWSEITVVISTRGGVKGMKLLLSEISEDRYERMKESGVVASRNLLWNAEPEPYDAFYMAMYQLWLRRHTIRYTRREYV